MLVKCAPQGEVALRDQDQELDQGRTQLGPLLDQAQGLGQQEQTEKKAASRICDNKFFIIAQITG